MSRNDEEDSQGVEISEILILASNTHFAAQGSAAWVGFSGDPYTFCAPATSGCPKSFCPKSWCPKSTCILWRNLAPGIGVQDDHYVHVHGWFCPMAHLCNKELQAASEHSTRCMPVMIAGELEAVSWTLHIR